MGALSLLVTVATDFAAALVAAHKDLFGYTPNPADGTKPNRIYYPSPPEAGLDGDYLALAITSADGILSEAGSVDFILSAVYAVELTDAWATGGGYEGFLNLHEKLLAYWADLAATSRYFAATTWTYDVWDGDEIGLPGYIGFNLALGGESNLGGI